MKLSKICVAGLGEVGLPTALYIRAKGFKVWGYDISDVANKRAKRNGIRVTNNLSEIPPVDAYVICVSTSLTNSKPDMSSIFDVCSKIAEMETPHLVSIESTVLPGTCRKVCDEIFEKKVNLVHVPHRYWRENPSRYGIQQTRVIGAVDEKSLEIGLKFYKEKLEVPLHVVSSIEIAEMCKVAENAYRYVQIAFAEELKMICDKLGLAFEEVRNACNSKWNIEILEARDGVKGHCLPKDVRYLAALTKFNNLLMGAISADQAYQMCLRKKGKP
jgi:UDP-N-acetyl-D-mannosaminuronic acid dehydrogenase